MDTLWLSRIQFAVTIGFHFIFPPLSIGLAWLLVLIEGKAWLRRDTDFENLGKFFAKLLGITFAVGVASGVVMEFQFGTNWSEYSKFVGDIFGAPLAAEGVFAFFLESSFIGLYLFGRNRVSKGIHWFACLMVAIGATISAFWILVANSWMQTPAGYEIINGRAELQSFSEAVFNPSMWPRFWHTMMSCMVSAGFLVAGVSAYKVRTGHQATAFKKTLKLGLIASLLFSILVIMPFGHWHAVQVAQTQPEKLATIEGLEETQSKAPLVLFRLGPIRIQIPGLLSLLAHNDINAEVQGLNEFAEEDLPPQGLSFWAFHFMLYLGGAFIGIMALGLLFLFMKKLDQTPWFLRILTWAIPLPLIAIQCGWIVAEVGRQPWIVYKVMRTADAFSPTVPAAHVMFSLIMFSLVYVLLFALYMRLMVTRVRQGYEAPATQDVSE